MSYMFTSQIDVRTTSWRAFRRRRRFGSHFVHTVRTISLLISLSEKFSSPDLMTVSGHASDYTHGFLRISMFDSSSISTQRLGVLSHCAPLDFRIMFRQMLFYQHWNGSRTSQVHKSRVGCLWHRPLSVTLRTHVTLCILHCICFGLGSARRSIRYDLFP